MFLSFGKKSTSKKAGSSVESPKAVPSPGTSSSTNGNGASTRSRATVQTVAGPLLASTRFNTILDASTYANVNSPGFTSRVVNCASNGSSSFHESSATHQSKYSGIGLFPKVQLGKHSILPTLSPRNSQKVARTPVRVRIAPPCLAEHRRHSISGGLSSESKDKINVLKRSPSLSFQNANKDTASAVSRKSAEDSNPIPEHFTEASRKRIFSECQDARDEAKKRRKKSEIPIPNPNDDIYQYRHVRAPSVPTSSSQPDASSQGKRARENGSPEEQKRQRRKICNTNNAIFSSLSSSRNLLERLAAQKRKSADTSRSSSPLTPLAGKHVKENKLVTNMKAVQHNLNGNASRAKCMPKDAKQQDSTPILSKTIVKRSCENMTLERNGSSSETHNTPSCDYTTKLFRKEVLSHTPRTLMAKDRKQSLWVQPPEADELSCSLLSDDSKLDRPERLKSLLACVSGKDSNASTIQPSASLVSTSETVKITPQRTVSGCSLPVSSSLEIHSPPGAALSSALTVTVSSTCTIMTSATVTSVNGVPSSESNPPAPQPSQVPALSSVSSPSTSFKSSSSSPHLTLFGQNLVSTTLTTSMSSPATSVGQIQTSASLTPQTLGLTTAPVLHSLSTSTPAPGLFGTQLKELPVATCSSTTPTFSFNNQQNSVKSPTASTQNNPSTGAQLTSSAFTLKSPNNASQPLHMGSSSANSALQFGSSGSNLSTVAKSTSQFGSGAGNASDGSKTAFQYGVNNQTTSTSLPAQPAFQLGSVAPTTLNSNSSSGLSNSAQSQFESNLSAMTKPTFSFGSSANNGSSDALKPALQFGSNSIMGEISKPTFQLSSNGNNSTGGSKTNPNFMSNSVTATTVKPTFSFGSNGNSSSKSPKMPFNFGSSNTNAPEVSKPALSFGSTGSRSSLSATSAFQFGSSSTGLSPAQKPAFQFSSNAATVPEVSKPAIQFGSNLNTTADTARSPFQFGSSKVKSNDTSKPSFQFSSNSIEKSQCFPTPTFGSPIQSVGSAFGQVAQQQNKGAFTFGSCVQPSISAASSNQNKGASPFGSTSCTPAAVSFDSHAPFGSTGTPAFGAPGQQPALPSFGSLQESKSNGFGTSPSFGGPSSSSFTSNSKGSTGSAFQFGDKNQSAGSSGSFAFGQNQDQNPSGFNFNATVTAVPNSSAQANQAAGLFSIGAGSSTNQRRIREVRRRR